MTAVDVPLTFQTALTSWRWDVPSILLPCAAFAAYALMWRRTPTPVSRLALFGAGSAVWMVAGSSFVGVYSDVLFWVRALQFVLLLMVAPLLLALGTPVTVLRDASSVRIRAAGARAFASRPVRMLAHPIVTSAGLLVTPWLIYLTPWYPALLTRDGIDLVTRILLIAIGFGYFYARLQIDPVPRRYPQVTSLLVTLVETLGDGALGVVIWQGGLIAASYYQALHRTWGPSIRTDQTIGAGVFWILGDVVGLPFLMVLLNRFRADERGNEREIDRILDTPEPDESDGTGLWWEQDPGLRDRYR